MHAWVAWGLRAGGHRGHRQQRALGGVIFNYSPAGSIGGGIALDACLRSINMSGTPFERSLNGGLRLLQSGSYQGFRDLFTWQGGAPSVANFTAAVNEAFNAWAAIDPAIGITPGLSFIADLATPVTGFNNGSGGLDTRGRDRSVRIDRRLFLEPRRQRDPGRDEASAPSAAW